jgi:hypothetical protein
MNFKKDKEIEEWINREAPHISDLRSRRKYYAKYWNVEDKIIRAKYKGEL